MTDLNEIFQRIKESKREQKNVRTVYRDVLAQNAPYQKVVEELNTLKAKKLQLETEIRASFQKEMEQLEKLTESVKADVQLMSDMAITKLMKGETIEVKDEQDASYEPVIQVRFKKAN
jgi:dGTP triphosphohydrolase